MRVPELYGCDPSSQHILLQVSHQLQLLLYRQPADYHLQYGSYSDVVLPNQAAVVHVGEHSHQEPSVYVSL